MKFWFISWFLILFSFYSYSQSIDDLRIKKENTLKEIEYTSELLNEVNKNRNTSLNQLQLLNNKINQRDLLIVTISNEIEIFEEIISDNELVVNLLQIDLKKIKDEYAAMIRSAYRNKSAADQLLFLFLAEDFNQAYRRYLYLKKYTAFRKNQTQIMQSLEAVLNQKTSDLKEQNTIRQKLVGQTIEEKETLLKEKEAQDMEIQKLQSEQKNLQQKLSQQRKQEQELENEIQQIIEEQTPKNSDDSGFSLTPEQKLIGDNFEQNKARLPWPVERGVITEHFGIHQHPVLTKVQIRNNGVNINTESGATVRAVFDGEVSRVFGITGGNTAVIIRHGKYMSVYSNLREVVVKKGDKVAAKQEIGTVYTDADEQKTVLKFQIWLENQKLDPEEWIGR